MNKKEVIDMIIKQNKGKHLEVLKRVQEESKDDPPGDIETIKQERKSNHE